MSNKVLDVIEIRKVDCDCNEMSFIVNPKNEDEYLAIISRKDTYDNNSLIVHNLFLVHIDLNFNLLKYTSLKTMNTRIDEKEIGIENCCLLNDHMFIGLVHGQPGHNCPVICLCHFQNDIIHTMTELDTAGSLNPIILKYNLTNLFAIHSYTPFQIMSFNMETGANQIVHMVHVFDEETFVVKRGSCVFLDNFKEYLLAVRVEKDGKYLCSVWITLTERFKLAGISGHFQFNTDMTKNRTDETCTSLVVKNNTLYSSVCIDNEIFIYEYAVEKVHEVLFKL